MEEILVSNNGTQRNRITVGIGKRDFVLTFHMTVLLAVTIRRSFGGTYSGVEHKRVPISLYASLSLLYSL